MPNRLLRIFIAITCFASGFALGNDSVKLLPQASNLTDALQAANSLEGEPLNGTLPGDIGNVWLHLSLTNTDTAVFHFPNHSVKQYSIYATQSGELLETFLSPFQSDTYIDWTPKFTLPLKRRWGNDFLMELGMRTDTDAPYLLMSFEAYEDLISDQLINSGVFYGAIALMALFSFLLYVLNNDKNAGRLSLSFTIWFLTMLSIWGYGSSPMPFGMLGILPDFANQLTISGALAGAWFTKNFLKDIIVGSMIYNSLRAAVWLQLIYLLLSFALEPLWVMTILINICSSLLSLGCCVLATARRDAAAKYLLGSSILIASPFIFILIRPFNQQTLIAVGIVAIILVMLALLQRIAEQTQRWAMKADLASERERFLASMSHEIRTPLNGIIGFSELANQEPLDGNVKTYFKQIDRSSKVLLGIVNDVLDYAKLQATEITPNVAALNIKQTIEDVITINLPTAIRNGIDLSYQIDASLPEYVTTDPQRCLQILINLCGNAVKFSKNGSVRITASQENAELVFNVIDNGVGIKKEVLAGLFNPFKQADASTARQFGGTGLGLAISKQLSELLGGTLDAVSEYGQGSIFTLRLPFEAAEPPEQHIKISAERLKGKRVLVAEDNPINLLLAAQILKKHGMNSDSAEDGKIALEKASKNHYDFILMDMQMPELSGPEATMEIRKLGISSPIIAMTANTSESDRNECLSSGMNDYLAKPIEQQHLLQKLVQWSASN